MIEPAASRLDAEPVADFAPIARPRLTELIRSAARRPVALIVAGAGYGKSVALRQALSAFSGPRVRFDVRAEHATLLGFLRGLADSFADQLPDLRSTVSDAYERNASSPDLVRDLAAWMHVHLAAFDGIIAVDDLHVAVADPQITAFLRAIIELTKTRIHWILATRSALDLPVASWVAYGTADLVEEEELRFTAEEAAAFAATSARIRSVDEIQDLIDVTSGWATALAFALRSSTRSADLRSVASPARELIYGYLAEQVYRQLVQPERELLRFASLLPSIETDVLEAAGFADCFCTLEALRKNAAFITLESPGVYHCHDLFRDFLRYQLDLEGREAARELKRRAAGALESSGRIPAALQCYSDLRSDEDVLRILEAHGMYLFDCACGDMIESSIASLDVQVRDSDPVAEGFRGMVALYRGDLDRGETSLMMAVQRVRNPELAALFGIAAGRSLYNRDRDAATFLSSLVDNLKTSAMRPEVQAQISSVLSVALVRAAKFDAAKRELKVAQGLVSGIDDDRVRALVFHRLGLVACELAFPFDVVLGLFSQSVTLMQRLGLSGWAAFALSGLATTELLYADNHRAHAEYAAMAAASAEKGAERVGLQIALTQLMDSAEKRGNSEQLRLLLRRFDSARTSDRHRTMFGVSSRAAVLAWERRFDEAFQLMPLILDKAHYAFDRAYHYGFQALLSTLCDRLDQTKALAVRSLDLAENVEVTFLHARRWGQVARLLSVIALALGGQQNAARTQFKQYRGLNEGPYVFALAELAEVLVQNPNVGLTFSAVTVPLENLKAADHAGLALILTEAICRSRPGCPPNVLTRSEVRVLVDLDRGMSPKEIAAETGRSVHTVRTLIQRATEKLGCSGRQQALAVARKRGLLVGDHTQA